MCTSLFLWADHPTLLFLLAFNRDEFLRRATQEAHFWPDCPELLAGRDVQGGGTWLGVTATGRFAMLTNFREVAYDKVKHAPSRGALTTDFLQGHMQPLQYLNSLDSERYNGFNLIVGDFKERKLAYFSNRSGASPQELQPGLYGISNGVLESKWPKVERGKAHLKTLLDSKPSAQVDTSAIFQQIMGDRRHVSPEEGLPQTGLPEQLERQMSSIFLDQFELNGAPYGTRSQTLLTVQKDGSAEMHERSLHVAGDNEQNNSKSTWRDVHHNFHCGL